MPNLMCNLCPAYPPARKKNGTQCPTTCFLWEGTLDRGWTWGWTWSKMKSKQYQIHNGWRTCCQNIRHGRISSKKMFPTHGNKRFLRKCSRNICLKNIHQTCCSSCQTSVQQVSNFFFWGGGGRLDRCWTRGWTCRAKCEQNIMKTNMFHEIHSQKPLNDDLKTHMLVEHHKKSNTIKSHVLAINRIRIS